MAGIETGRNSSGLFHPGTRRKICMQGWASVLAAGRVQATGHLAGAGQATAPGAGQVQVHSMQHRNGREIWGACSTAAGSRRRRRKKEGARAGGGLSSAHRKISRGGAYIGMERGFLACMSRKKTGRTAGLGRKGFSYFPFYKKIQQIRFEFKLHEFKFKSNHKQ